MVDTVAVASPLRQATDVGTDAARRGGNAIDAAIATAAMLAVAYPANCGVGGDLLALVRDPDGRVTFVNASGRSPRAIDPDAVRSRYDTMPMHGPLPVTVPGVVGGWDALHRHGAALAWTDLFAPAQSAAADGVPVSAGLASSIAEAVPLLGDFPDLAGLLAPEGHPLAVGQTLRQPALARTLHAIADAGAGALYDGDLTDALCAGLVARGVPIVRDDLREFEVTEGAPLVVDIAGWRVQAGRPNSQAYLVPRLLGMLASIDTPSGVDEPLGVEGPLHRRITADRLALAFRLSSVERDAILADPRSMVQNVDELLAPEALRAFGERVMSEGGAVRDAGASGPHPGGDTVAIVAADDEGRSVSLIQSLFHGFGSLILEPSTGIVMHDRGACFVLDPASPNVLEPGKRPLHTLAPVLAESLESGERLVVGTMGGHAQGQILTQVLSHLFAGASAQQAVSRPRMTVGAWESDESDDTVAWEDDLDPAMVSELAHGAGMHTVVPSQHSRMGHAHAIRIGAHPNHMDVGTDPRADG